MSGIKVQPLTLDMFTHALDVHQPFSFVRYGDGEFNAVLGVQGENCDGHKYYGDMGNALAQTLHKPRTEKYFYGIGPKATKRAFSENVNWFLERHAVSIPWHDSEVFLTASLAGALHPLIERIRNLPDTVLVGPRYLQSLHLCKQHIPVPEKNAWLYRNEARNELSKVMREASLILFSSGFLSKVLIWELHPYCVRKTFLWDTGSVFDMYCGRDSRTYARKLPREQKIQLLAQNFATSNETSNVNEVTV